MHSVTSEFTCFFISRNSQYFLHGRVTQRLNSHWCFWKIISRPRVDLSKPKDAYIRPQTRLPLVQIQVTSLFPSHCLKQCWNIVSKINLTWKCRLGNGSHFVSVTARKGIHDCAVIPFGIWAIGDNHVTIITPCSSVAWQEDISIWRNNKCV